MDDAIIGGSNLTEHDDNLCTFLKVASEVNLTFSHDKCIFCGTQLCSLGHIVRNGTISPDPE